MPRVLVIDDSKTIRLVIARYGQEWGIDVDDAEDGEKGLERLEELVYDLIILDYQMPVLDGPETLQKLRENGVETPVIMLTSEAGREAIMSMIKMGVSDYIHKPFKPEELKQKMAHFITFPVMSPPG